MMLQLIPWICNIPPGPADEDMFPNSVHEHHPNTYMFMKVDNQDPVSRILNTGSSIQDPGSSIQDHETRTLGQGH